MTIEELFQKNYTGYYMFDEKIKSGEMYKQVDYLSFYCNPISFDLPSLSLTKRDNPCRSVFDYDNTFIMRDEDNKYWIQYCEPGRAPVVVLRWAELNGRRLVSIYGKGLKLYYDGKIDRLRAYVEKYQCLDYMTQRVDICFDSPVKPLAECVSIACSKTIPDDTNWVYKGFGNPYSPCFMRIYDKTEDLRKDKFAYAWLYPPVYREKQIRRLEYKLTLQYAKINSPLEWLDQIPVDKNVEFSFNKVKRNAIKNMCVNAIYLIDYIDNVDDQLALLTLLSEKIGKKIKKTYSILDVEIDKNEG